MQPQKKRVANVAEEISFAINECYLGYVLVAQTQQGICAVCIGDDPEDRIFTLQNRFPRASFTSGDKRFEKVVQTVMKFIDKPTTKFALPLDINGTAFQKKVWKAVTKIPCGATVTYSEIATRIGSPKAVRAVGSACSANPLAVIIPCHRVVSMSGVGSGYRWGINRKAMLLERENRL